MEIRRRLLSSSSKIGTNKAGDVAYVTSSGTIKTCDYLEFSTSMGTPIGVVVVPAGFMPDGKTRIIGACNAVNTKQASTALNGLETGNTNTLYASNSFIGDPNLASAYKMCNTSIPTGVPSFQKIPTYNGIVTVNSTEQFNVPTDNYATTNTSSEDPLSGYYRNSGHMIRSPYKNGEPNPQFFQELFARTDGRNINLYWMNDFTTYGTDITAYGAACHYKIKELPELQWYLPTAAELAFMDARSKTLNTSLTAVVNTGAWTKMHSTYAGTGVYGAYLSCSPLSNLATLWGTHPVAPIGGYYHQSSSNLSGLVRPFAIID